LWGRLVLGGRLQEIEEEPEERARIPRLDEWSFHRVTREKQAGETSAKES